MFLVNSLKIYFLIKPVIYIYKILTINNLLIFNGGIVMEKIDIGKKFEQKDFKFSGIELSYLIITTIGIQCAITCLIQNFMGKESYIKYVSDNWTNTHWLFWLFLLPALLHINRSIIKKGKIKNEK